MVLALFSAPAGAQRLTGVLRLQVRDPAGAPIDAAGTLQSLAAGVHRAYRTGPQGFHEFGALPFGLYRLEAAREGFSTQVLLIEVASETPIQKTVTLGVAAIETTVVVRDSDTLLDPRSTGAAQHLGPDTLSSRRSSAPGRSVIDLVDAQPGWLLEANGILHPRGSEYAVQYVIDGVPLYDNRSPAFAQTLGVEEFESLTVRTASFPAEFGRRLGGVIEVNTERDRRAGWRGHAGAQGGSFSQYTGLASLQYTQGGNSFGMSGEGLLTDRYLDPPVEQNYTNHASGGGFSARFDRDWSPSDVTRFYAHRRRTGFQAPNEQLQQAAGQRQDRAAGETLGQAGHQHLFSPRLLLQARAMVRDTWATLWSNPLSTPIQPAQDRGFREGYFGASLSLSSGAHEFKAGGDALFTSVRESFAYHIATRRIAGVRIFDGDLPADFEFRRRGQGREESAFVQDLWRRGRWTFSAGLRLDRYRLLVEETAWSPRLGVAYHAPSLGLVLRASYDRIFQPPAVENVLLAGTNLVEALGGEGAFLPLRPSRGNYFEAGFAQRVLGKLRLEGTWYQRRVDNFADDSLLFNTGVSFPIAFHDARIHGYEAKIELPRWGPWSGFASYSNMSGTGRLPVAGGLFLGDEAAAALAGRGSFPITQDQRNTLRSRFRVQARPRVWLALGGAYNSGLPFELESPGALNLARSQYGAATLAKVNFERGRVRPSATLDASAGVDLSRSDRAQLRLQADVFNLGNRFNLINFAGVLSGTALEARRSFAVRLNAAF